MDNAQREQIWLVLAKLVAACACAVQLLRLASETSAAHSTGIDLQLLSRTSTVPLRSPFLIG
jgi:hypothetical protein